MREHARTSARSASTLSRLLSFPIFPLFLCFSLFFFAFLSLFLWLFSEDFFCKYDMLVIKLMVFGFSRVVSLSPFLSERLCFPLWNQKNQIHSLGSYFGNSLKRLPSNGQTYKHNRGWVAVATISPWFCTWLREKGRGALSTAHSRTKLFSFLGTLEPKPCQDRIDRTEQNRQGG